MRKLYFTVQIFYLSVISSNGQVLKWVKSFGGYSYDVATSVAVDHNGNVYTTGTFYDTIDINPGPDTLTFTSSGGGDIFSQKFSPFGELLWARSFGGRYSDHCRSICVDNWGNVYTTGSFSDTVDFDPGNGVAEIISNHALDVFVLKLDHLGKYKWAKSLEGGWWDDGNSICTDKDGNVYLTGSFEHTVDFDPSQDTFYLSAKSPITSDIFIQKLDSLGNFLWAKSIGGKYNDAGLSMDVDVLGNVYVTGYFGDTVDFDPGASSNMLKSELDYDVFVLKLSSSGNFQWAKSFGNSLTTPTSIVTDTYKNVYLTGDFTAVQNVSKQAYQAL